MPWQAATVAPPSNAAERRGALVAPAPADARADELGRVVQALLEAQALLDVARRALVTVLLESR